jgi:hypothetical protein
MAVTRAAARRAGVLQNSYLLSASAGVAAMGEIVTELQRKDRAYLYFSAVGVCVLMLTLVEIEQGPEALAMLLVFLWLLSVPLLFAMIALSAAATLDALTTKPADWPLILLAIITIPYELFALDNVVFFAGVLVVSNLVAEIISVAYSLLAVGFSVLWALSRRKRYA